MLGGEQLVPQRIKSGQCLARLGLGGTAVRDPRRFPCASHNLRLADHDAEPAHHISPVAFEAVKRIDAIFDIERDINGLGPKARLRARSRLSAPLLAGLEAWLRAERARMSRHTPVAKAINTLFEKDHWPAFTRFLTDGRVCLTNNAAERSLRGTALGRKAWLFAGSDRGGDRTAFMYSLIVTAKMNDNDPQAWLADVLARMPAMSVSRLPDLLPWNWRDASSKQKAA